MESHIKKIENSLQLEESFWIYSDGLSSDYEDFEELLKQPAGKIIHDMELLIRDALENPFIYQDELADPVVKSLIAEDFVLTAFMVLGDLESEKSLHLLFRAFSMDREWIDYFIHKEYGELLWDIIIHLGKNQLDEIYEFVMDTGTSTWVRAVFSEALEQLALNYPEYRNKVIDIKERIIKYYISGDVKKSEEAIDHAGMTVWSLMDLGSIHSLPLFKKVFEMDLIEKNLVGDLKMAEASTREYYENNSEGFRRDIMKLIDRHAWYWDRINEEVDKMRAPEDDFMWDDDIEDDNSNYRDTEYDHLKVSKSDLPRRNDPCPCGSGKKYKNCCMMKDIYPESLN